MVLLYRDIFVMICFGLLGWGLIRPERIYQYPFFMGFIFVSFILPQVFGLINYPDPLTQQALERALLVSCLCAAACWLGYQVPSDRRIVKKLNVKVDERRLLRAALVVLGIAYFFHILLRGVDTESIESIAGAWTGKVTIYAFFRNLVYIPLSVYLWHALRKPSITNIFYTVLAAGIPIQTILIGRRQPVMIFLITIGFISWIVYRLVPPRWLVIIFLVSSIFIIPVMGQLRGEFWELLFTNQWDILLSEAQQGFVRLQEGKTLELKNAALFMDAVSQRGLYGLGAGWWDNIIHQYFPAQIFGRGLKFALQFNLSQDYNLYELYQYRIPTGTTVTGIGDSFREFGYLGCLIFAIIGYMFKCLWISSMYDRSIFSVLLYVSFITPAMVGVTHGIGRFWQEIIIKFIVILGIILYAKRPEYK